MNLGRINLLLSQNCVTKQVSSNIRITVTLIISYKFGKNHSKNLMKGIVQKQEFVLGNEFFLRYL